MKKQYMKPMLSITAIALEQHLLTLSSESTDVFDVYDVEASGTEENLSHHSSIWDEEE